MFHDDSSNFSNFQQVVIFVSILSMLVFLAQSIKNYAPALIVLISISDKKRSMDTTKPILLQGFSYVQHLQVDLALVIQS